MGGGMNAEDMMKNCDMMGGGMMGGSSEHMSHMMSMMREKLSHAADRVAALKTELKFTEAQTPAWNKFADALVAASKSMKLQWKPCTTRWWQPVLRMPSRKARIPCEDGSRTSCEPAGD